MKLLKFHNFVIFYLFVSSVLFGSGCAQPISNIPQLPNQAATVQVQQLDEAKTASVPASEIKTNEAERDDAQEQREQAIAKPAPGGEVAPAQNLLTPPQVEKVTQPAPSTAPGGTYTNVYGNTVPRPYQAPSKPAGASAKCRDGSYSFSQSRRGTCSHHGGVAEWY